MFCPNLSTVQSSIQRNYTLPLFCFLNICWLPGQYEHCNPSNVFRVQLESRNCWFNSIIFLLGLPSYTGAFLYTVSEIFFWMYSYDISLWKLLPQILGGIWADRFGGKAVLGFGVVWWSLATVLTPLAAKIGLPCLLVMRAFMGIGEVRFFYLSLLFVLHNLFYLSNNEVCAQPMSPSYIID